MEAIHSSDCEVTLHYVIRAQAEVSGYLYQAERQLKYFMNTGIQMKGAGWLYER